MNNKHLYFNQDIGSGEHCKDTHTHTHAQTYTHVRTYARTHARTRTRTSTRTHTHTHKHTHIHTHTHTPFFGTRCIPVLVLIIHAPLAQWFVIFLLPSSPCFGWWRTVGLSGPCPPIWALAPRLLSMPLCVCDVCVCVCVCAWHAHSHMQEQPI